MLTLVFINVMPPMHNISRTPQPVSVYLGCLNRKFTKGSKILWVNMVCFSLFSITFFLLYIDKPDISAGTKNKDNIKAISVPTAVNIPKSFIMVRYAPKTNDTKPMAVVTAASITGTMIYPSD